MPLMFLAMYSYWWKAAYKRRQQSVIVLMPEDAPELDVSTAAPASYQG